jgi:hypothetical protein
LLAKTWQEQKNSNAWRSAHPRAPLRSQSVNSRRPIAEQEVQEGQSNGQRERRE